MAAQTWSHDSYEKNARFVSDLGMPVVALLAPRPGERVLDLGCGDGVLTKKLKDLGALVVGVDASPDFIKSAQTLGLDARLMDGQALGFDAEFDAVFSNAALHWMKEKQKVVDGVWRALRPGGRFVAEMGGQGNVDQIEAATRLALKKRGLLGKVPEPNFYPSPKEYRELLEGRGFQVESIDLFARPTPLPGDLKAWLQTFRKAYLAALDPPDVPVFLDEIERTLKPVLRDAQGLWTADYVRLRFKAFKPGGLS
jgi:trans-aconitate methyltransferase